MQPGRLKKAAHAKSGMAGVLDRRGEVRFAPLPRQSYMEPERKALEELRIDRSELEPNGVGNRVIWLLAAVFLVVGMGVLWWIRQWPVEVRTEPARCEAAQTGPRTVLNASGYVVARREATVSSKMTGRVVDVFIEEGMRVAEDQVLARLDDVNLQMQLELAKAQEAAARGGLVETQVRLEEAERERTRILRLAQDGVSSEAEVDRVEAEVKSLGARLDRQALEVTVANRRVQVLMQELEDTIIRAPFAGVVVAKNAQPGEMISPISAGGGFTRTGIGTIVDMDSLEVEVDVNESYLNRVEIGQAVQARLDAYPAWPIPCRVLAIIPTADRQKATIRVRVAFEELDPRILPQMGVRVAFLEPDFDEKPEAFGVVISREALHREDDQFWVWVVHDGILERREVTVRTPEASPVVVESGLEEGELVVVDGPADPKPGRRVRERDN